MDVAVRTARDEDAEQLITLIGGCFAEYPGCVLDVDGEMPELLAIATFFTTRQGHFWVAEHAGQVVGSVGVLPATAPQGMELRKLYVARAARRRGLGGRLCDLAEAQAKLGLNVREELAAPLGGEVAVALDGPALPVPSWKLAVEVYDPARLEASIRKLVDSYNRHASAHGDPAAGPRPPGSSSAFVA